MSTLAGTRPLSERVRSPLATDEETTVEPTLRHLYTAEYWEEIAALEERERKAGVSFSRRQLDEEDDETTAYWQRMGEDDPRENR
jgi:hypothetical protein